MSLAVFRGRFPNQIRALRTSRTMTAEIAAHAPPRHRFAVRPISGAASLQADQLDPRPPLRTTFFRILVGLRVQPVGRNGA